ncbi:hypothetical protein HELRODRAFT_168377 [Helobdella robusta]|uniref:Uncharacterized protein n=1 Tax=Helobdella robusta TaxID=6412 RepID=T1F0I3_HELRO|nr:hypothetical protein HELRODRAFT_168377 [Helobdella robusta]ESO09395.1 hypothetical protein HELRODRAFT_168377 [Helobdella robusta]
MTYYSTCKQLSFGRTNFGRPTTKSDTTMINYSKNSTETESLKTVRSNSTKRSRHFDHLFTTRLSDGNIFKITDEKTYKEALKYHFHGQKGAYRKFNNLLSKLKVATPTGGEVDIMIRLVDSLRGRKDLIEHLTILLPSFCSLEMQKDALVLKVCNLLDSTFYCFFTNQSNVLNCILIYRARCRQNVDLFLNFLVVNLKGEIIFLKTYRFQTSSYYTVNADKMVRTLCFTAKERLRFDKSVSWTCRSEKFCNEMTLKQKSFNVMSDH